MYIDKAIKKQKKQYKNFMLVMCFIFLMLPIILFLTGLNKNLFLDTYLIFIELIIMLSIFVRFNIEKLEFTCSNNKLKIIQGISKRTHILLCDKVDLVHTENFNEDIKIIIVISGRFRNKKIRPIGIDFLRKYPNLSYEYLKIKKRNPEIIYYYIVVKKGALKKYSLLDTIYRNCVKAVYTEDSIENIRIARGQKPIKKE